MRPARRLLLLGVLGLWLAPAALADVGGAVWDDSAAEPLLLRNDHPLYLTLTSTALPDRPKVLAPRRWAWDVGYLDSNTIADQNDLAVTDRIIVDAELQRLELRVRYGMAERWEASAAVPYLVLGGGYMDSFIESFDDTFDAVPRARSIRGDGEFRYLFMVDGRNLIDETDETRHGLGDIPLQVKYQCRSETAGWFPTVALRGMLKLPTATDSLLGNGRVDGGVGVLAEQPLGERFRLTANLDVTSVHLPMALKTVDMAPVMVSGLLVAEHRLTRRFSWMVQYAAGSNPYPKFDKDMTALNRLPMGIGLGVTYRTTPRTALTVSAGENINSAWPDFSWSAAFRGSF